MSVEAFIEAYNALPTGYSVGAFEGRRWGATVTRLSGGANAKLYAEELGGSDFVSFNLFRLADGRVLLKPCEMPEVKVVAFVMGYKVNQTPQT